MKNKIVKAYDRMTPPQDAKERMMRNIQRKQDKKDRFYTATPMTERKWAAIPAALVLICVLVGGWWILTNPGQDAPELGESTPTVETKPDVVINVEKDPKAKWEGVHEIYWDILNKYQTALTEKWDVAQWERNGLNHYIPQRTDDIFSLGYSLIDFNGDGSMEMLISDGYNIFGIYVMADGAVVSRQQDENRIEMYLVQNNWIYTVESSDFSGTYHTFWWYGQDGLGTPNLVAEEVVFVTRDGQWYAGPNEKDAVLVTESEAMAVLEKYQPQTISVNRFSSEVQENTDILAAGFAQVLEKYVQAHTEEWTAEEYMQNDICYVLGLQDSIWEYGYTLMDLNGDGIDELIITDGSLIYDMYILVDDGGAGHILSAGERQRYYLCKDNVIGYRGSGGAANMVLEFYKLENVDLVSKVRLEFDTDTWYILSENGTQTPGGIEVITEEQAEQIVNSYAPVEIIYQSILRPGEGKELKYPRTYEQMLNEIISDNGGASNLFVSVIDVTGDGNTELLLGAYESFGHVYTVTNGEVKLLISYGTDNGFTLCEDGVICYHDSEKPFGQYTFVSLKNQQLQVVENLQYEESSGSWLRDKNGTKTYISDAEKQEIIESYGSLSVARTYILDYLGSK